MLKRAVGVLSVAALLMICPSDFFYLYDGTYDPSLPVALLIIFSVLVLTMAEWINTQLSFLVGAFLIFEFISHLLVIPFLSGYLFAGPDSATVSSLMAEGFTVKLFLLLAVGITLVFLSTNNPKELEKKDWTDS